MYRLVPKLPQYSESNGSGCLGSRSPPNDSTSGSTNHACVQSLRKPNRRSRDSAGMHPIHHWVLPGGAANSLMILDKLERRLLQERIHFEFFLSKVVLDLRELLFRKD